MNPLRLLAACALVALSLPTRAATITIDGSQADQVIAGFGVNANHRSWNTNELPPVLDALISQGGVTLFRVIFDSTEWESSNDNNDPNVMNWDYYNANYSTTDFERLWGLIGYLNQRGITNGIVLNFQGPGPGWLGGASLTPGLEDEWAERIVSLLLYARNTRHLQFNLVAPNNEPDIMNEGISVTDSVQYLLSLRKLAAMLDAYGLSDFRFVAPDLAGGPIDYMQAMLADPVVMAKMAHFGLHSYTGNGSDSANLPWMITQSAYPDRDLWVTEFNVWCGECESGQYGSYDWSYCRGTAEYLFGHLNNGVSAGLVWEGYDSYYVNVNGSFWSFWGLFGINDVNATVKTYTPRKNFYTLAQIAKFVRPGARRLEVGGDSLDPMILQAFYHPTRGQLTITGVNPTDATTISGALQSLPAVASLDLYYTDANTNLSHSATFPVVNGAFTVTIPGDCVFTLTGFDPAQLAVTVAITNPVDGASFTAPANITLQAAVSTTTGTVSTVTYFNGASPLGTSAATNGLTWSNVPPGSYVLSARATNSVGNVGVAPDVNIAVVGPLAQIHITPANGSLVPHGTQQFVAVATDTLGTPVVPQPVFSWSTSGGGTIDSNGLFTSDGTVAGPFTLLAKAGGLQGTASLSINLAPGGTGYTWYSLNTAYGNSPRATAPSLNDGDLNTDFPLLPGGAVDDSDAYEAAGIVWPSTQTVSRVLYRNGSYTADENGVFAANFSLQFTSNGTTWYDADPSWTGTPPYSYNSPTAAEISFTFNGNPATVRGVRCVGQVRTSETSPPPNSWVAAVTELQAFYDQPPPMLRASLGTNGITISWTNSTAGYVLETTTNPVPPVNWLQVTNAPQTTGYQQHVLLTPAGQQQYFRLRRQ